MLAVPLDSQPWSTTTDNDTNPYGGDVSKADETIAFLQSRQPPTDRPWLLWFGIVDPHPPYASNDTYLSRVNASAVDVPPPINLSSMNAFDQWSAHAKTTDGNYTDLQLKTMRKTYWAACEEASDIMGGVMKAASDGGWLENTVRLPPRHASAEADSLSGCTLPINTSLATRAGCGLHVGPRRDVDGASHGLQGEAEPGAERTTAVRNYREPPPLCRTLSMTLAPACPSSSRASTSRASRTQAASS